MVNMVSIVSDQGNTWEHIGIYPLGIYDYVDDIDGDKDVFGRVYIAFSGAGFAYGDEKGKTSFESNYSNIQMKISYYNKTIGVNNVVNRVILKVYNPNGKLLMEKAGKDNFMVNISALQSDVLIITLDNGKNKFSEKIVHY